MRRSAPSAAPCGGLDWTPAEVELLRERYPRDGAVGVARLLGRTASAVTSYARAAGIRSASRWSEMELAVLREWYPRAGSGEVSRLTGRARAAVQMQALKRGIRYVGGRTGR